MYKRSFALCVSDHSLYVFICGFICISDRSLYSQQSAISRSMHLSDLSLYVRKRSLALCISDLSLTRARNQSLYVCTCTPALFPTHQCEPLHPMHVFNASALQTGHLPLATPLP